LIAQAQARHLAKFYTGGTFRSISAKIAFLGFSFAFIFALDIIDARRIKNASFYTSLATITILLLDINNTVFVQAHGLIFTGTSEITGMVGTMLATIDGGDHRSCPFIHKYPFIIGAYDPVMKKRTYDFTGTASGTKRNLRRALHNMSSQYPACLLFNNNPYGIMLKQYTLPPFSEISKKY